MHKQLVLLHNAVSAYFSGNAVALESTLKQFNIKVRAFVNPIIFVHRFYQLLAILSTAVKIPEYGDRFVAGTIMDARDRTRSTRCEFASLESLLYLL